MDNEAWPAFSPCVRVNGAGRCYLRSSCIMYRVRERLSARRTFIVLVFFIFYYAYIFLFPFESLNTRVPSLRMIFSFVQVISTFGQFNVT